MHFFINNLFHYNFYELKNAFFLSKIDLNNNLGDQIFPDFVSLFYQIREE